MTRPPRHLVISCGSSRIVAVLLSMGSSGHCELVDYWVKEMPLSLKEPLLWLKAASHFFGDIRTRFKGESPVAYVLPGHLALSKYLVFPQPPLGKRDRIIAFEAKQNIPYPIESVAWDNCVIEEDGLDLETLIVACKTELVESLSLYGRDAKMDPDSIEPSFVGLINSFRYSEPGVDGGALLVSIGARSSDIILLQGKRYYSRNVPLGGDFVTLEMGKALDASFEEAERLKLSAGAGEVLLEPEQRAYAQAAERFLQRLEKEISRTIAIASNNGSSFAPALCRVTGGGCLLPGIEPRLKESLGIPVERHDPLKRAQAGLSCPRATLERDKAFISEALGIGIGRFLPDSPKINLLPSNVLWQRRFRRQQPYYLIAGLVACAAVALPLLNTIISVQRYEQEIQNLDTRIMPIRQLQGRLDARSQSIEELTRLVAEARTVAESRANWTLFLSDMQRRLSEVEDVWLDRIEVERDTMNEGRPNRFADRKAQVAETPSEPLRLRLEGRLLDVANPLSSVSQESNKRVFELLESFAASEFVARLEDERFDNNVPGILKFNFTLVVDSRRPL